MEEMSQMTERRKMASPQAKKPMMRSGCLDANQECVTKPSGQTKAYGALVIAKEIHTNDPPHPRTSTPTPNHKP